MGLSPKKAARILRIRKIEEDIARNDFFQSVANYKKATDQAKKVGQNWIQVKQSQVEERMISYVTYFNAKEKAQNLVVGSYRFMLEKREELLKRAVARRSSEKLLEYAKEEAQTREFKQELSLLDEIGLRKKGGES